MNVIPLKLFHQLKCENLEKTTQKLCGYGGKPLNVKGKCTLTCKYKGISEQLEFFVVSTQAPSVLGLSSCLSLKLIKLILSVNGIPVGYEDLFQGLGSFPGVHKIHLKPDATPIIHPPRKIPAALREKLARELQRMEELGVITKVSKPSDWVNSIATPAK